MRRHTYFEGPPGILCFLAITTIIIIAILDNEGRVGVKYTYVYRLEKEDVMTFIKYLVFCVADCLDAFVGSSSKGSSKDSLIGMLILFIAMSMYVFSWCMLLKKHSNTVVCTVLSLLINIGVWVVFILASLAFEFMFV